MLQKLFCIAAEIVTATFVTDIIDHCTCFSFSVVYSYNFVFFFVVFFLMLPLLLTNKDLTIYEKTTLTQNHTKAILKAQKFKSTVNFKNFNNILDVSVEIAKVK